MGDLAPVSNVIFRPWFTTKDGKRIYAKSRGKKAWPIPVKDKDKQ